MKRMKGKKTWFVLSVLIAAVIAVLLASCPVISKEKAADEGYGRIMRRVTVDRPQKEGAIALFPLTGHEPGISPIKKTLLTLDEAIAQGGLVIKELEQESVNQIAVKNESSQWIFIMAGEILTGSKQDRILKDDLLLPPRSGRVVVNAFCVEHGRWSYKSDTFSSNKTASNIAVRQKARESNSQGAVWKAVEDTQRSVGCAPSTQALNETYKAPVIEKNIDSLFAKFRNMADQHGAMNGVAVAIGDEILCADIFGDNAMLRKLWPKLLKSYLLEAMSRGKTAASVTQRDVERFIDAAAEAECSSHVAPGEGSLLTLDSRAVTGSALMYSGALIHTDIFSHSSRKSESDKVIPLQRRY
jgi:hypothetical protein